MWVYSLVSLDSPNEYYLMVMIFPGIQRSAYKAVCAATVNTVASGVANASNQW